MEKVSKILNKITKVIFNTILVILTIIALILIYNIIQMKISDREYMNIFGYSLFQVQTGSMSGTMEIGDIIVVKITQDVEKEDIITFKKENTIITHRIIEKQDEKIVTKGDANNAQDEGITQDVVIGKVVYILKNVEIWKNVFTTPEVYILVIITLTLFGISSSIKDEKKE